MNQQPPSSQQGGKDEHEEINLQSVSFRHAPRGSWVALYVLYESPIFRMWKETKVD